ncbi:DUF2752 domain-containing protein [Microbispora corallina]|uniref:Membrane protein n=1 Tax=Microbispora corallina TaxID=83302 RepID=A0ABQ4FQL1_9ACTN|nr:MULTISPECIES: DUF2752 domain-containing protein [Microbispora]ETK36508.1 membrane protein [Microbispora sp. ATCC PTA-5024]GIH37114.1 membrane protein [Microbispora corallina]
MAAIVPGRRGADRLRSVLAPLGVAAATAAAFVYVGVVDPNRPGHYPTCPFLFLTGLYCPGCGTLRAMHALGHADVAGALGFNPLAVATVPFLLFWWGRWALRSWQGRPARTSLAHPAYLWGLLAIVIVFWVARNTSYGHFLAP